jgi:hypothetical protein
MKSELFKKSLTQLLKDKENREELYKYGVDIIDADKLDDLLVEAIALNFTKDKFKYEELVDIIFWWLYLDVAKIITIGDDDYDISDIDDFISFIEKFFNDENDIDFKSETLLKDNSLVCSGCLKEDSTVIRDMFDGLCADCTNKALYDYNFAQKAEKTNEILKK